MNFFVETKNYFMKKIIISILVLVTSNYCCYSKVDSLAVENNLKIDSPKIIQNFMENDRPNLTFNKEYYKQKSVSFNNTGNTLLITGSSLILGGLIIASDKNIDVGKAVTALGLMFFGTLTDLISIPFFISSNHNAKLAKALP